MSDSPLAQCPSCGKEELQRLIGGGLGVIFKGSGFYVNDAREAVTPSSDGANTCKQDSKEAKNDSAKADRSSDSSASTDSASTDKKATA